MSRAELHPILPATANALFAASRASIYLQLDESGAIVGWNELAAVRLPLEAGEPRLFTSLLTSFAVGPFEEFLAAGDFPARIDLELLDASLHPFAVHCTVASDGTLVHILAEPTVEEDALFTKTLLSANQELTVMRRESSRKSRELAAAKAELERVLEDLKTTHWHLKKVSEVVSLCMDCGRIKTDESQWDEIGQYFLKNSILASHGLCPPCADAFEARIDSLENKAP